MTVGDSLSRVRADPINGSDYTAVDHSLIATGLNNNIKKKVYYEFGQLDKSTLYMTLQNNETEDWEPPAEHVPKPSSDGA